MIARNCFFLTFERVYLQDPIQDKYKSTYNFYHAIHIIIFVTFVLVPDTVMHPLSMLQCSFAQ